MIALDHLIMLIRINLTHGYKLRIPMDDTAEKVNRTGYELETVKVSLNRDIDMAVSDIKINGKQGEILNIPRWVATVLEEDDIVTIQESVNMLNELKQALSKEQISGTFELTTIDPQFYIKLKHQMKKLSGEEMARAKSELNRLFRIRRQKIIRYADSSEMTADIAKRLTVEERLFYDNLHNISNQFEEQVTGDL